MTADRDDLRDRLDAVEDAVGDTSGLKEFLRTEQGVTADFIKFGESEGDGADFETFDGDESEPEDA